MRLPNIEDSSIPMYLSFYDLIRKPFEITVDPDFLWLGEMHKEALATLEYGIREDKGFLLLTGDVGTGKTVLINRLARNIHCSPSYRRSRTRALTCSIFIIFWRQLSNSAVR